MKDFIVLLPEIYVLITAIGILIGEVGYYGERTRLLNVTAWFGLGGAFIQSVLNYRFGAIPLLDGLLLSDGFSLFLKPCFLLQAAASLFFLRKSHEIAIQHRAENIVIVLLFTVLMMMAVSSANLLLTALLISGMTLLVPLLLAQKKQEGGSVQSSIYFGAQSILAMTMIFLGVVLIFSASGSFHLDSIHKAVLAGDPALPTWTVALILFSVGVFSLMGVFPGQLWIREGYSGGPIMIQQLISWGFRSCLGSVLLRALVMSFAEPAAGGEGLVVSTIQFPWMKFVAFLSGATLIYGALLAYRQTQFRKLLAALNIIQSGFFAIGILSADQLGYTALLYMVIVDLVATLGMYGAFSLIYDRQGADSILDLRGSFYRAVPEGILLLIALFTFIGAPPLAGYLAKANLINITMRHNWDWLTLIAIFTTVLSLIASSRFALSSVHPSGLRMGRFSIPAGYRIFLVTLFVPLLALTLGAEWVLRWAGLSVGFIFW